MNGILKELEANNQTIKAQSEEIVALRKLLASTTETLDAAVKTIEILNGAMRLIRPATTYKRGRGRPAKTHDESALLDAFNGMKAEFLAAMPHKRPTDSAVLNWYFEKAFLSYGKRASKAHSPEFQSKLKRLKNRLGDVRNPIEKLPIK